MVKNKKMPMGWSGPAAQFWQCYNPKTKEHKPIGVKNPYSGEEPP